MKSLVCRIPHTHLTYFFQPLHSIHDLNTFHKTTLFRLEEKEKTMLKKNVYIFFIFTNKFAVCIWPSYGNPFPMFDSWSGQPSWAIKIQYTCCKLGGNGTTQKRPSPDFLFLTFQAQISQLVRQKSTRKLERIFY